MTWFPPIAHWRRTLAPVLLCLMLGLPAGLSACSPFSPDRAPLPDSTFSRLLVELHLLSARTDRADGALPPHVRDSLFQHYQTDREAFNATLRYFSRRPSQLKSIYNAVIDTLNAIEQQGRRERYSSQTQ